MKKYRVFIDESGNPHLHNLGEGNESNFLTFVAIKVEDNLDLVKRVKFIQNHYFSGKEIKGSHLGTNDRKLRVINDLSDLKFYYYSISYDKKSLLPAFQSKDFKEFYKYCLSHFIKKASHYISVDDWVIDKFGDDEFSKQIITHLNINNQNTIFNSRNFW